MSGPKYIRVLGEKGRGVTTPKPGAPLLFDWTEYAVHAFVEAMNSSAVISSPYRGRIFIIAS